VSEAEFRHRGVAGGGIDHEPRLRKRASEFFAGRLRKRGVALGDERQRLLVEAPEVVQQAMAEFAAIAGALRDPRVERDERRLPAIGKHHRLVVAGEGSPERAPLAEPQVPMSERQREGLRDFRHAPVNREDPRRREDVDRAGGLTLLQPSQQRMAEDRVADPRGSND
jgi:hypothetical protein